MTKTKISQSSQTRIKAFVDDFIRSEYMQECHQERIASDYGVSGRFQRCMDAAETGSDGSTHQEVIDDWRNAFSWWLRNKRNHPRQNDVERFTSAVGQHFDDVEAWHEKNGSLYEQIG